MYKLQFKNNRAVLTLFLTALFFYFFSESLLRQYLISGMSSEKINLDTLLMRLPGALREQVKNKILKAQLQDNYNNAKTESEIIYASMVLVNFDQSQSEVEKVYADLLNKYPTAQELSGIYLYFYRTKGKIKSISYNDLHEYMKNLSDMKSFSIWQGGLSRLQATNGTFKDIINFLKPILDLKPKYKDFSQLYLELAEAAFQAKDYDFEAKARKMEELCDSLPTVESEMIKQETIKKK